MTAWPEGAIIDTDFERRRVSGDIRRRSWLRIKNPEKPFYIIVERKSRFSGTLETVMQYPALIFCLTWAVQIIGRAAQIFSQPPSKGAFLMKKVIRASSNISTTQEMFTLDDFVCLLHWIKELQGMEISLSRVSSGGTCLVVGNYAYPLEDILQGLDVNKQLT